jgi:thiol-disulfide isomerase/thioredoxin
MKSIIYLFAILFLVSCQKNNSYVLNGSFSGDQNEEWIYMVKFLGDYSERDSAKIENGKFQFKGNIEEPEVYVLHYHMDKIIGANSVFLEPGTIDVIIDPDNWDINSKATGGKNNNEYNKIESERIEKFVNTIWKLEERRNNVPTEEKGIISDSIKLLWNKSREFEINYIKKNFDSPVALFIFNRIQRGFSIDEFGEFLQEFDSSLQNTLIYKSMLADYENQLDLRNKSFGVNTDNDFRVFEVDFKNISLMEMLIQNNPNKILYIDFWATWCGACLNEFPYSKMLFDEIDTTRINMIYLCSNSRKEDFERIIKSKKLKGQHYLLDNDILDKFKSEHDIKMPGIPHYIIVGKDGKIINRNAPRPSSENALKILTELTN